MKPIMLNKINWGVSASHTSWLCMVCFVVYQFFQQGVIGILSTPLREDFQLNSASLSLLSSSFYFPYLLMQIPVGILYDRYGLKNAACTALVASIASLIWFASAPTFTSLIIARMAMGTTSAFAFVGMLITIQRLLPKTNFALFMALGECVAMWMVGIANQVVSSCNEVYGWRPSLIPIALFGLLIVTVLWIFGQDIPANSTNSPNLMKQMHKSKVGGGIQPWVWVARLPSQGRIFFAKLGKTFALRSVWAAGAFSGLAFSVVSVFQALWLIPYLEHIHEMETQEATRISSMLYLGIGLACPFVGYATNKIRVMSLIRAGLYLCILWLTILLSSRGMSALNLSILLFALGFSCSIYQLGFVYVTREAPEALKSIASAAANMVMMVTGAILQLVTGCAISWLREAQLIANHHDYLGFCFQVCLCIIPLGIVAALGLTYLVKDDEGISLEKWTSTKLQQLLKPRPARSNER